MRKIIPILFVFLLFGLTIATTIHSVADIRMHLLHLSLFGSLAAFFVCYVLKDAIKIKNRFALLILPVLVAFFLIRAFPCHILSSNPSDIAHATVVDHPCSVALTSAIPEISPISVAEAFSPLEQLVYAIPNFLLLSNPTDKSPPLIFV